MRDERWKTCRQIHLDAWKTFSGTWIYQFNFIITILINLNHFIPIYYHYYWLTVILFIYHYFYYYYSLIRYFSIQIQSIWISSVEQPSHVFVSRWSKPPHKKKREKGWLMIITCDNNKSNFSLAKIVPPKKNVIKSNNNKDTHQLSVRFSTWLTPPNLT